MIVQFSNDWTQTRVQLDEQKNVNQTLTKDLDVRKTELQSLTNSLEAEKAARSKVETDAQRAAQIAQEEMQKRDAKIVQLEGQVDEKTKQMSELNQAITGLEKKIGDTEKELASTKGDKEFLLKELKRLQGEKAKLEAQFQDLMVLREQVRKLKDQLAVARRLEWIRMGQYATPATAKGGGQRLMQSPKQETARPNSDLNVEFDVNGGVRTIPGTNAPPK
jgi:chromosome segregation ATPase